MKKMFCTKIDDQLLEKVKNIVYFTPGLTMGSLTEQLFEQFVKSMEKEKSYPQRKGKLKQGNFKK